MIFLSKRSYSLWWERKTESLISNISSRMESVNKPPEWLPLEGSPRCWTLEYGRSVEWKDAGEQTQILERGRKETETSLLLYSWLYKLQIVYLLDQEWIIGLILLCGKSLEQKPKSDAVVKHQRRFVAYTNISHVHVVVLHHATTLYMVTSLIWQ